MADMQALSQTLERLTGQELTCERWEVERGAIARFAEAVGDPNPLWRDEQYAQKTRFGGIIAPPTFIPCQGGDALLDKIAALHLPSTRTLNGGNEVEFFLPAKPGDVITSKSKLADARLRKGGTLGVMLFLTIDVTHTNQEGKVVAAGRNTLICY